MRHRGVKLLLIGESAMRRAGADKKTDDSGDNNNDKRYDDP
ncbi:hypothetical protein ENKO_37930 [Enterobacter kobei]|uniref:Uncharacterized protein n=1 Tax=Enterobacter kobei TaxID=208224 RepID=A0AA86IU13_9ENTR|nr:hypothetical protein ENKO_37930 [Enterobacter kobei]